MVNKASFVLDIGLSTANDSPGPKGQSCGWWLVPGLRLSVKWIIYGNHFEVEFLQQTVGFRVGS